MSPEEKKKSQRYFSLQPSEKAVFKCASQIFAAYICSGKVTEENKKDYYKIAIKDAIRALKATMSCPRPKEPVVERRPDQSLKRTQVLKSFGRKGTFHFK